jgi:hypothetical protein
MLYHSISSEGEEEEEEYYMHKNETAEYNKIRIPEIF